MGQHWSFFRHGDSPFGLFFPRGYTVAAFPDMDRAMAAEKALQKAGIPRQDVRAVSGEFVAGRLESDADRSRFERFRMRLDEALGSEGVFIEQDIAFAHGGGAFLFVHTPDDAATRRVAGLLDEHHPEYARRYKRMAIEPLYENGRKVELARQVQAR